MKTKQLRYVVSIFNIFINNICLKTPSPRHLDNIPNFYISIDQYLRCGNMVAENFLRDERGQLVGTPLKLVIAVVIGVAVLGILLQMMNLVSVMNPHSFNVEVDGATLGSDGAFDETTTNIAFIVKDANDGRDVQGAIVEIKGAGESDAQVTSNAGRASFSNLKFKLAGADYAKVTITVSKEGYSRWTNTYLVKD